MVLTLKTTCEKSPAETERSRRRGGAGLPWERGYIMDNRRFTVSTMPSTDRKKPPAPSLWLGGSWLSDYGFDVGDKLELIQGKNMLILVKASETADASGLLGGVRLAY